MHEGITVREATIADMDVLLLFEQGVISAERSFDPTLKSDPIHYYDLVEMINAPHIYLVVAVLENEIIGSGYARLETAKHYLQHPQHAYLGFMYVAPAHRGKGVNKIIIDALAIWSRKQGQTELRLDVYFNNAAAINAYERAGFTKHMIEMRRPLT